MWERRTEERRPVDIILNVYQNGFPVLARAQDMSVSGVRLKRILAPRYRNKEQVELEFQLPNDAEIYFASGECVHLEDDAGTMGIRFLHMNRRSQRKLRQFVESPRVAVLSA